MGNGIHDSLARYERAGRSNSARSLGRINAQENIQSQPHGEIKSGDPEADVLGSKQPEHDWMGMTMALGERPADPSSAVEWFAY